MNYSTDCCLRVVLCFELDDLESGGRFLESLHRR